MNQYETIVILTPVLSDDDVKISTGNYKEYLKQHGAQLVHEELWGLRQLAYPIRKKTTGIYYLLEYIGPGNVVGNLELQFTRDENVLRHHTIRLDKYSIDYNERKRRGEIGRGRKTETKEKSEPSVA
ncbi:MAG: 30S ribosomal protein S6 [Fimbriimonadaceae bacterium]|nr:30S ribosomal protein S6 [Chitinophagales bacterium]